MNNIHRDFAWPLVLGRSASGLNIWRVPVYRTRLEKVGSLSGPFHYSAAEAARVLGRFLLREDEEGLSGLMLSEARQVIGLVTCPHAREITPADVLRPAIAGGAAAVVLARRAVLGRLAFSNEEISFARRTAAAGRAVGIAVEDCLVIGHRGRRYASLAEQGLLG